MRWLALLGLAVLPVFTMGTSASRARAVTTMNHAAVRATSVLDGGNVAAVAFVPNDRRRAYAVLATNGSDPAFSGVARSVDGGSSWSMATVDACAIGLPAELVFDGSQTAVPIVLGASGGFLESADGGSSWRCQVDPSELRARSRNPGDLLWDHGLRSGLLGFRDAVARQEVAIDGRDPRHLVRADSYGPPAYSTDGGATWTTATSGSPILGVATVAFDPIVPDRVYAAGGELWVSDDGGRSWRVRWPGVRSTAIGGPLAVVDAGGTSVIFARMGTDYKNVVVRSDDGGATFARVAVGFDDEQIHGFASDPRAPGVLLAATATGVWRSGDAGKAWVASTAGIVGSAVPILEGSPRAQYAFSRTGFSASRDGGLTWTWKALPGMSRISELVVDPADNHSIFAATEIGLYGSRDDGDTWTRLHAGSIRAVAAGSGARSRLLILTPKPGVGFVAERSDDGGRGWSELSSEAFANEQPAAIEIDPFDDAHLVVSSSYAISQSYDAGASWSRIRDSALGGQVTFFGTAAGLMLASSSGRTWTSVDSGRTWSAPDVYSGTDPFTPDPVVPGRRYRVGGSGLSATDLDGNGISYSILPVADADRAVRPVVLATSVGRRIIVARPGGVSALDVTGSSLVQAGAQAATPSTGARRLDARRLRASGALRSGAVLVCRPLEQGARTVWTRDGKAIAVGARYRVRRADRGHRIACRRAARNGRAVGESTPRLVPRSTA